MITRITESNNGVIGNRRTVLPHLTAPTLKDCSLISYSNLYGLRVRNTTFRRQLLVVLRVALLQAKSPLTRTVESRRSSTRTVAHLGVR